MKHFTQTVTASAANGWAGNCWQTCVAMMLDVDPETMPAQAECDLCTTNDDGTRGSRVERAPYYSDRLRAYLREHHSLSYVEIHCPQESLALLRVADPGWHMMTGLTIRSANYGGMRHVVIGRYGEVAWDPHPSHAGLLDEIQWSFLVPYPKAWRKYDAQRWADGKQPDACRCPMHVPEVTM